MKAMGRMNKEYAGEISLDVINEEDY